MALAHQVRSCPLGGVWVGGLRVQRNGAARIAQPGTARRRSSSLSAEAGNGAAAAVAAPAQRPRCRRVRAMAAGGTPEGRSAQASEQQQAQQERQQDVQQQQQQQQQQRPQEVRRDPRLAAAGAVSLSAVGAAAYSLLSSQPQLPPVQEVLGPAAAVALGGPALGLAAAKALLGDMFHVELHRWVLGCGRGSGMPIGACAPLLLSPRLLSPLLPLPTA